MLGSFLHRLVLAAFVYITDGAQLAGALFVVRPWTREKCNDASDCEPSHLCVTSALIFALGLVVFYMLQRVGESLIARNDAIEADAALPLQITTEVVQSTAISETASNEPYSAKRRPNSDVAPPAAAPSEVELGLRKSSATSEI